MDQKDSGGSGDRITITTNRQWGQRQFLVGDGVSDKTAIGKGSTVAT
jgi:hypothetical protein